MAEFKDLQKVLAEVLQVSPDKVTPTSVAKDFKLWDSIAHANIILEIEDAFEIEFGDDEIFAFENVGAIFKSIQAKTQ